MAHLSVLLIPTLALISSAQDPVGDKRSDVSWFQFKARYGKHYPSTEEEAFRRGIYNKNLELIELENSKDVGYTLDVNQFADLLTSEWASKYFGMARPSSPFGSAPYLGRHMVKNATLPSSIDWTQKGAVTEIKNQGQCGSCWAFSTTGSLEGAYQIATGTLTSLSEQQLVDCAGSFGESGCQGGLMDSAFKYAEQAAMCTESSYPYQGRGGSCRASSCATGIPKGSVTGFHDVAHDSAEALMSAVAQQPVSIAIEANLPTFQLYRGGVLSGLCGAQLDHGVLVVGYGTDPKGGDYWKVKNSWGKSWGMDGYVLLKRGKPGAGECGILKQPSYPVVSSSNGPSPAPVANHYEKPPCQSDEVEAQVQSANGEICAPRCDNGAACPTDVPVGTKATPKCILQDQSGGRYCALTCFRSSGCPSGASCARIGGLQGVCVYPLSDPARSLPEISLHHRDAEVNI